MQVLLMRTRSKGVIEMVVVDREKSEEKESLQTEDKNQMC